MTEDRGIGGLTDICSCMYRSRGLNRGEGGGIGETLLMVGVETWVIGRFDVAEAIDQQRRTTDLREQQLRSLFVNQKEV